MTAPDFRPQLFARNETQNTITFNNQYLNWELPPYPDPNYIGPLPWDVAISSGFDRLWDSGSITVALDNNFVYVLDTLPGGPGGVMYLPYVHLQIEPQSSTVIQHNLGRAGPVMVVATSPDQSIEYINLDVTFVDTNNCRISFDDPIPFLATVF